jgi:hypothetical protein
MYAALLSWFIRRPDDGPIGTKTCNLPFIKYDVPDVNCFIILVPDSSFGAFVAKEFFVRARALFFLRARLYTQHEVSFVHKLFLNCLLSYVPRTPMYLKPPLRIHSLLPFQYLYQYPLDTRQLLTHRVPAYNLPPSVDLIIFVHNCCYYGIIPFSLLVK